MNPLRLSFAALLAALMMLPGHAAVAGPQLDDATILAIFDQANAIDIYTARMGAKYGHSQAVRELGRAVAADHEMVQQMGRDLARTLGIVPTPPAGDTSVADQAKTVAMLSAQSGTGFDAAYLRHEIAYHQAVIDALKNTLLPAISNPEFKALVNKVLPGFEHHLAETKAVARKLGVN
ncbi:MAG TPA: DUF4142 domain-containing protein [Gammaproteobacteria bacterium]|nr:DUF4142 domain-containing protein [Gammaproteobacteria bacterium]